MPIYEYQCKACQHQFEALQKFSDAPLTECPVCHQATVEKLISAAGFQLKGSGWYVTDYKGKSGNNKTDTKTETTTDSKPKSDDSATGSS